MTFETDRKRALGLGSAGRGTERFWSMTVSSVGLLILVPLFVFTFGPMLGEPHGAVVAHFSRPFPALVAALTLAAGWMHFKNGVQVLIDDYAKGLARKALIVATACLSYAATAVCLFSIARMAL